MYEISENKQLATGYNLLKINAPLVAARIEPGQFVVLRIDEKGERIPMTVCDYDREEGLISTVVHAVGKTTKKLSILKPGETILNVAGPLGFPSKIKRYGHVVGVCRQGTAAALYPIMRAMKEEGNRVTVIIGAKTGGMIIFEDEMRELCDRVIIKTDDGSAGSRGYAIHGLTELLEEDSADLVMAIGPTTMMKTASKIAGSRGTKVLVSLGAIMLDGTGMCGACRVTVGGNTRFACVQGPEFDGSVVDFDELKRRQRMYLDAEKISLQAFEKEREKETETGRTDRIDRTGR